MQSNEMIITDKYLIKESGIFFLFADKPFEKGILDMEDLSEFPCINDESVTNRFISGPL